MQKQFYTEEEELKNKVDLDLIELCRDLSYIDVKLSIEGGCNFLKKLLSVVWRGHVTHRSSNLKAFTLPFF